MPAVASRELPHQPTGLWLPDLAWLGLVPEETTLGLVAATHDDTGDQTWLHEPGCPEVAAAVTAEPRNVDVATLDAVNSIHRTSDLQACPCLSSIEAGEESTDLPGRCPVLLTAEDMDAVEWLIQVRDTVAADTPAGREFPAAVVAGLRARLDCSTFEELSPAVATKVAETITSLTGRLETALAVKAYRRQVEATTAAGIGMWHQAGTDRPGSITARMVAEELSRLAVVAPDPEVRVWVEGSHSDQQRAAMAVRDAVTSGKPSWPGAGGVWGYADLVEEVGSPYRRYTLMRVPAAALFSASPDTVPLLACVDGGFTAAEVRWALEAGHVDVPGAVAALRAAAS